MKTILSLLLLCSSAFCLERIQVECSVGGKPVVTSGVNSTTRVMASYPNCTINVYITGSGGTHATIFSNAAGTVPLSNPFTADSFGFGYFYTANGHVDVQISGGNPSLPAPYTFGDINVFESIFNFPTTIGCWYSPDGSTLTTKDCLSKGAANSVQISDGSGAFLTTGMLWNASPARIDITGGMILTGDQAVGGIASFVSGKYNGVQQGSTSTGALLSGVSITQSPTGAGVVNGGYLVLSPIDYNPYLGPPCFDQWGNPVQQPLPLVGSPGFGTHDSVLWVGTSPSMPSNGSCGTPLPGYIDDGWGLNTNHYFFARGGLATDNTSFNAINALSGGVTAISFTAGGLYNTGTVTHCCGTLSTPTYIGGYVQVGHSASPPAAGTIATVDNPLTAHDGINQGTMYWDDTLSCLRVYNGSSWICVGSGGGGGAAGATTQIQYNGGSGTFAASAYLTWDDSTAKQLTVTGVVQATVGYVSTGTNTDTIQAPVGGVTARWLIGTDSLFLIEEAAPPLSGPGQMRMYADTSHSLKVSFNGGAYTTLGGGGGSPGGSNTNIQFNNSGSFGGSANFTWDNGAQQLTITGQAQATIGFNATSVNTDAIQAASGGVTAKWLIAKDSVFWLNEAAPTLSAVNQARMYLNNGDNKLYLSRNNAAYERVATSDTSPTNGNCAQFGPTGKIVDAGGPCTTGSGSGTVTAGLAKEVAYYPANGTSVSGDSHFYWDSVLQLLTVTGIGSTAGMAVANGYIQSDGGFLTTSANYNAVSITSGGVGARSLTAVKYTQAGNNSGVPTLSTGDSFNAGALYWDLSTHTLRVFNDAASWQDVGGGGGGTPGGANTNIQYNNSGSFGGTSNFTWDNTNHIMRVLDGTGGNVAVGMNGGTPFINGINSPGTGSRNFWYMGSASGAGAFAISDGTGTGGFDTFGAQIYGTAYNGQLSAHEFVASGVGTTYSFANQNSTFLVDNAGNITTSGSGGVLTLGAATAGLNITANTAANSIQTRGGVNVSSGGSSSGVYEVNGTIVINSSGIFVGPGISATGNITTTGTISSSNGSTTFANSNLLFQVNNNGSTISPSVTALGGGVYTINGHASFPSGVLQVNDTSGAGSAISVSHGGTVDGYWQAGGSGATATVFDATTSGGGHRFIVYQNGHIQTTGSFAPSISGGSGCSLSNANDMRGQFTCTGSGNPTITFGSAYTSTPVCTVTQIGGFFVGGNTVSTTNFTATVPGSSGGTGAYICIQ
jgi:hypothetical protein